MILLQSNSWTNNFWLPLLVLIVVAIGGYFLKKLLTRKKFIISINYDSSFWTTFEGNNYVVINLTIINDNEFDFNTLTIEARPNHVITDNIYSAPTGSNHGGTAIIIGAMKQIENSFKDKPISIPSRDRRTGNLVFESETPNCTITKLVVLYQDKQINVLVNSNKIVQRTLA